MKPYWRRSIGKRTASSFTPAQVAALYGLLKVTVTSDTTIALIELGGGYDPTAIAQQFATWGLPAPVITDVSVDGASNGFTGNPSGPDVEVELDICVAAAVYSYATGRAAQIAVYFAPNSTQGFLDAIAAVGKSQAAACGISWGEAENEWGSAAVSQMNTAISTATANGVVVCVAAGDSGSGDGEPGTNADCPGSCDDSVCCGGSTIVTSSDGSSITSESVWNDNGGASGGGYSSVLTPPSWQVGIVPAGKLRGVPDLVALADPGEGWDTPFGPVGGTSAVAPFMAAFFAVVAAVKGSRCKVPVMSLVYPDDTSSSPPASILFRYVSGSDGAFTAEPGEWNPASGLLLKRTGLGELFPAEPGEWNPASGLGAPKLSALGSLLTSIQVSPPAPPAPPPTPPAPTPTPTPMPTPTTGTVTLSAAQGASVGAFNAAYREDRPFTRKDGINAIRAGLESLTGWAPETLT
jgi:kumamolisin